jgi:hypothetical protein
VPLLANWGSNPQLEIDGSVLSQRPWVRYRHTGEVVLLGRTRAHRWLPSVEAIARRAVADHVRDTLLRPVRLLG